MMLTIALVIAGVSAFLLVVMALLQIPKLRVLDVSSLPEVKTREMKERLILDRFDRFQSSHFGWLIKGGRSLFGLLSRLGRRLVQKVYSIEQYYRKLKQVGTRSVGETLSKEKQQSLLDEALRLTRAEEYVLAEKKYVELIGLVPTSVDAYEGLGNLYLRQKQFEQAEQAFSFAKKLEPENPSVLMSYAELRLAQADLKQALSFVKQVVQLRPKNPKYLDWYLEIALQAEDKVEAAKALASLQSVNPENQKLKEFEQRLHALKASSQT